MKKPREEKTLSGKYAIALLVGLGVAAAIGSQWYYFRVQQRPLQLWEPGNAKLILKAPLANAWLLGPADARPLGDVIERIKPFGGEHLTVLAKREVTREPGFSHIRNSFMHSNSYDWSADLSACKPEWKYALDFSVGDVDATLLFAPNCQQVMLAQTGAKVSMSPVFDAILKFLREQFPEDVQK